MPCLGSILKPLTLILLNPLHMKNLFHNDRQIDILFSSAYIYNIKALYKKGSTDSSENYRPISLTCVPCKMEKKVRDAIVEHMISNNLFLNSQYGFRSLRYCDLQLLDVMDKWTIWNDKGTQFDCIYYDFKKLSILSHIHVYQSSFNLMTPQENYLFG